MTKVKICGIRSPENALMVAGAGADLIGLNFYRKTPRYVEPERAGEIASALRAAFGAGRPTLVGVFVNASADEVRKIAEQVGLDLAQLSGDETVEIVCALDGLAFKAIRPVNESDALMSVEQYADTFPARIQVRRRCC